MEIFDIITIRKEKLHDIKSVKNGERYGSGTMRLQLEQISINWNRTFVMMDNMLEFMKRMTKLRHRKFRQMVKRWSCNYICQIG